MTDQTTHQATMRAAEAAAALVAKSTIRTGEAKVAAPTAAVKRGFLSGAVGQSSITPPGERAAHAARIAFGGGL